MTGQLELSIVVAAREPSSALEAGLRSLAAQAEGRQVQVLLAVPPPGSWAERFRQVAPETEIVYGDRGLLVPHLWGYGIARATGRLVGLTIGRCVPASDWVATLSAAAAEHPNAAGFGGPIAPPVGGSGRDWAAYFVRYSSYLGCKEGSTLEIPGDNSIYRRDDLERDWTDRRAGFWEVLFHRRLRERGRYLLFLPRLRVRLASSERAWSFARLRARHGHHFGSTRVLPSALWRPVAALAAPLLSPMLLARIWHRLARARPEWRLHFRQALPWMLLYLGAWSLGEATGYLLPHRTA